MAPVLERASRIALDLLFPPQCALCGAGGTLLCGPCIDVFPATTGTRCERCWMPLNSRLWCQDCSPTQPLFTSIRSPFVMDGGVRRIAHQLKYDGLTSLAAPMAKLIADRTPIEDVDVIVPVPLHRSRARSRGFNQAAELGRALASGLGLPFDERSLQRLRPTAPLAKTMRREERRAIVQGAFRAAPGRVNSKRLLLVDDVVTTGATLDACSEALLQAGVASVRCVTWARRD
jgi:ComF family protein